MGLGTNLKRLLKDKNMTIKELSSISGVSLNTLYSITKRDNNMSRYDIVKKIASSLNVTVEELTGYKIDESRTNIKNARLFEVIKNDNKQTTDTVTALKKLTYSIYEKDNPELTESFAETLLSKVDDKTIQINNLFVQLNEKGQDKAVEQVELLTKIPEYRKDEE